MPELMRAARQGGDCDWKAVAPLPHRMQTGPLQGGADCAPQLDQRMAQIEWERLQAEALC